MYTDFDTEAYVNSISLRGVRVLACEGCAVIRGCYCPALRNQPSCVEYYIPRIGGIVLERIRSWRLGVVCGTRDVNEFFAVNYFRIQEREPPLRGIVLGAHR